MPSDRLLENLQAMLEITPRRMAIFNPRAVLISNQGPRVIITGAPRLELADEAISRVNLPHPRHPMVDTCPCIRIIFDEALHLHRGLSKNSESWDPSTNPPFQVGRRENCEVKFCSSPPGLSSAAWPCQLAVKRGRSHIL
jgi:hypothetical protein